MRIHSPSAVAITLSQIFISADSQAACDTRTNWTSDPNNPIKIMVGYEPEMPTFHDEGFGYDAMVYPIKPPRDLIHTDRLRELSQKNTEPISYFERDGMGEWRVCRIEHWLPANFTTDDATKSRRLKHSEEYRKGDPLVENLTRGHIISTVTYVYYDAKGRIERVSELVRDSPGKPYKDIGCRRYDDQNRLVLSIRPKVTTQCPLGSADIRDSWFEFKHGKLSEYGTPERLLWKRHIGHEDGQWEEEWHPFVIGSSYKEPWGHADVSSTKGVTLIWGAAIGQRDDNSANTVLDPYGTGVGSNYEFTRPPVPVEVLLDAEALYKYERRRYTIIDGVKMYELFAANRHFSSHRYYILDGLVLRHEQLNPDGTAKRVITLNNYGPARPGPNPLIDDKLLARSGRLLHQVFHRVYEIDGKGKPKLVAMSWNRRKRLIASDKVPVEFADLVYGTPDGKERWKSQAEFEKAFDTSDAAVHVFPDRKPRSLSGQNARN